MVNVSDIINILVPNYKIKTEKKKLIVKEIEKVSFTTFDYSLTFINFLSCIIYQKSIVTCIDKDNKVDDVILNDYINKIKDYMENNTFCPIINIKKLLNLISQNIINNELILFLSNYFNFNIYVYSFETKLLKLYYLEEKLNTNKESIIIIIKKDYITPNIGYQTLIDKKLYKYNDDFIQNLINNIYIIPIGLIENKKLELTDIDNNVKLIIDNNTNKTNILLNNDITDNVDLEDDTDYNDPLLFKINIKKIIKKFSNKKLLNDINKLKIYKFKNLK
jgi:hypothetical protein